MAIPYGRRHLTQQLLGESTAAASPAARDPRHMVHFIISGGGTQSLTELNLLALSRRACGAEDGFGCGHGVLLDGDGNAGGASRGWGRARRSRLEDVVRRPDVRYCSPCIILGQEEVVSEVEPVYRRGAPSWVLLPALCSLIRT